MAENFRLSCYRVGLTYSRCDDLKVADIETLLLSRHADEYEIWKEEHKDGGIHYHCAAERTRQRFDSRNARFFDVQGFHPNIISRFRSWRAWREYIRKNGECVARYPNVLDPDEKKSEPNAVDLALSGDVDAALRAIRRDHRYLIHSEQMERTIRRLGRRRNEGRYSIDEFNEPIIIPDHRTVIISGDSGLGKTQWALAKWPNASRITNFRRLNGEYYGGVVIIDDCDSHIQRLERSDLICLLDTETEREVSTMYGTCIFEQDCRRIILTNCRNPVDLFGGYAIDEAIARRIQWIRVGDLRRNNLPERPITPPSPLSIDLTNNNELESHLLWL